MSEPAPLVTVILPAYNAASFITRALDSVLDQTHANLEVIVVNDGSTDATADVVSRYCEKDDRVRLLNQNNSGVAAARNLAIANAKGEFIAPIDADDIWYPQKIEQQLAKMIEGGESVGLVYSWWVGIDDEDVANGVAARWRAEGTLKDALLFVNFIGNASVPLFRKTCIEDVGAYNEQFLAMNGQGCEDWDITLRIAEKYDLAVAPAYLSGYRHISGSMSEDWVSMAKSYNLMIDDLLSRRPDVDPKILAWSRSHFYRYIASKPYVAGEPWETLSWLRKSAVQDPFVLLPIGILKLSAKCIVKGMLRPISSRIWADREEWLAFRERWRLMPTKRRTLAEMIERAEKRAPTWAWRPYKPYDNIMRRRWIRLAHSQPSNFAAGDHE